MVLFPNSHGEFYYLQSQTTYEVRSQYESVLTISIQEVVTAERLTTECAINTPIFNTIVDSVISKYGRNPLIAAMAIERRPTSNLKSGSFLLSFTARLLLTWAAQ